MKTNKFAPIVKILLCGCILLFIFFGRFLRNYLFNYKYFSTGAFGIMWDIISVVTAVLMAVDFARELFREKWPLTPDGTRVKIPCYPFLGAALVLYVFSNIMDIIYYIHDFLFYGYSLNFESLVTMLFDLGFIVLYTLLALGAFAVIKNKIINVISSVLFLGWSGIYLIYSMIAYTFIWEMLSNGYWQGILILAIFIANVIQGVLYIIHFAFLPSQKKRFAPAVFTAQNGNSNAYDTAGEIKSTQSFDKISETAQIAEPKEPIQANPDFETENDQTQSQATQSHKAEETHPVSDSCEETQENDDSLANESKETNTQAQNNNDAE